MRDRSRREFLKISGVLSMATGFSTGASAGAQDAPRTSPVIAMDQDGLGLSPAQIIARLDQLLGASVLEPDQYGLGESVETVERYFAQLLGKPRALFMPSGSLANQLALRTLAGEDKRVVVQALSHVYNDTGDASQTLSGLTLLPLAEGSATFSLRDLEQLHQRSASGRVRSPIGVISIESPVRRAHGELFDHDEMRKICRWARKNKIRLHLDGARLFIAAAYTGITPAAYAAEFDTVYISLWKCFNCLNGAILAGSDHTQFDRLIHMRRMFGGALFNAWPFALLARHYAQGFVDRVKSAIAIADSFMASVANEKIRIERIERGMQKRERYNEDSVHRFGCMRDRVALRFVVIDPELRIFLAHQVGNFLHRLAALCFVEIARWNPPVDPVLFEVGEIAGQDHRAAARQPYQQ